MTAAGNTPNRPTQLPRDPLDFLWRMLCAPLTARILLIMLVLLILLGQAIPQLPAGVAGDPGALARWTAELPQFLRDQVGWMQPAGLLNVYDSFGLRLVLGLTALALLISIVDGVLSTRRFLQTDEDAVAALTERKGEWKRVDADMAEIVAGLREDMLVRRYLLAVEEDEKLVTLRAVRWPAYLLAHAGALVALLGLVLNISFGWETLNLAVPPNQVQAIGHGDYALKIDQGRAVADLAEDDLAILSLFHGNDLLMTGVLPADRPLHYRNLSISQRSTGPLVRIRGESEAGEPLLLAPHPRTGERGESLDLAFGPAQTERYFRSVRGGQVYRVELSDTGLLVDVYGPGETVPALSQLLGGGEAVTFAGERVIFSQGHYVVLDVHSNPAWGTMLGGALLILAGVVLVFYCPRSRLLWRIRSVRSTFRIECLGLGTGSGETKWPSLDREPEE